MSGHTPGPWEVARAEFTDKGVMYEIIMPVQRIVAFDARLIAAAPALKEALEHILEYWNGSQTDGAMSDALEEILFTARAAQSACEPPKEAK